MQRRTFLLSSALAFISQRVLAKLSPTTSQTEGPYYPTKTIPLNNDLIHHAGGIAKGEHLELSGIVKDSNGQPLTDALVEIWQCDASGYYRHPHAPNHNVVDPHFAGAGAMRTSASGEYSFKALLPVPYTGRPPHIHVKIHHADEELLTSQLYLKGKEKEGGLLGWFSGNRSDLLIDPVKAGDNSWQTRFDFVVEKS